MSFLGSMGIMMNGSELTASFETVYGKPTVRQIFGGKSVLLALRGHSLVDAVLMMKLLRYLFPTDNSYFHEVDETLTDEEQDKEGDLGDIEFNDDDLTECQKMTQQKM